MSPELSGSAAAGYRQRGSSATAIGSACRLGSQAPGVAVQRELLAWHGLVAAESCCSEAANTPWPLSSANYTSEPAAGVQVDLAERVYGPLVVSF